MQQHSLAATDRTAPGASVLHAARAGCRRPRRIWWSTCFPACPRIGGKLTTGNLTFVGVGLRCIAARSLAELDYSFKLNPGIRFFDLPALQSLKVQDGAHDGPYRKQKAQSGSLVNPSSSTSYFGLASRHGPHRKRASAGAKSADDHSAIPHLETDR